MITKFIEPWILFPGALVIVLAFLSIALLRRRTRQTRTEKTVGAILAATAVLLYAASTPAAGRVLLGGLERRVPVGGIAELRRVEAVVVLGGGVLADVPSESLLNALDEAAGTAGGANRTVEGAPGATDTTDTTGALTAEAESRLVYGMRLARRLAVPIVVTGGRVLSGREVPAEADVAAKLLRDLGVPEQSILIESESRTTAENAINTRERFGFTSVAVVTSAYHMPRALTAFDAVDVEAVPAPAPFRTDRRRMNLRDFMPSAGALYGNAVFLRETVGMWYYRVRYSR